MFNFFLDFKKQFIGIRFHRFYKYTTKHVQILELVFVCFETGVVFAFIYFLKFLKTKLI